MKINIKESFTSVFEESDWKNKFILGILFLTAFPLIDVGVMELNTSTEMIHSKLGLGVISLILLLKVFACLMSLALMGYTIKYTHNKLHNIEPILPRWKNYIKQGFFGHLIVIFYLLIILIPIFLLHLSHIQMQLMKYSLIYVLMPFITFSAIIYSEKFNIKDAFNFKNIFSIFKKIIKQSYFYGLLIMLFALWHELYDIIKILPINIIIKIPMVLSIGFVDFWLNLVGINIFVQIYKLALQKQE